MKEKDLGVVENSKYDNLEFIDTRQDSNYVGIGSFLIGSLSFNPANIKVFELAKLIRNQISNYFSKLQGEKPTNRTLVYQLQKFYISSNLSDGPVSAFEEIVFRATFYEKRNDKYYLIKKMDTAIWAKNIKLNMTKFLLNESYKLLVLSMKNCMSQEPYSTSGITYTEVLNEEINNSVRMPLYTNTTLIDGVLLNFYGCIKDFLA